MTVDREQTRRDAGFRLIDSPQGFRVYGSNFQRMAHINDLSRALRESRAELEQAERERDEARQRIMRLASIMGVPDGGQYVNDWKQRAENVARAETRLAKVPALVEALRYIRGDDMPGATPHLHPAHVANHALTVWEQEQ